MRIRPYLCCAGRLGLLPLMCLTIRAADAGSATWNSNPTSGDWNTAANWTPAMVPNGPADTATFATSQITAIAPTEPTEVNSIVFSLGADMFTITSGGLGAPAPLTVSGTGIINNSGLTQAFVSPPPSAIRFNNDASAGEQTNFTNGGEGGQGGLTLFSGSASAGSATFTNLGSSLAGGVGGTTEFAENSTAAQGIFINNGGLVAGALGGITIFASNSTAGTGSFTNNQGAGFGGEIDFFDSASADHGVFTNHGSILFHTSSTAANGTFSTGGPNGGGTVSFVDTSNAGDGDFTLLEDAVIHVLGGASLGNATITANGATGFGSGSSVDLNDATTADHATLIANGGTLEGATGGTFNFEEGSTAAEATLIINPTTVAGATGGSLEFSGGASAGDSNIIVNGAAVTGEIAQGLLMFSSTQELVDGTAANSTIIATGGSNGGNGGEIRFLRNGLGGTCRIQLLGNSQLVMFRNRNVDLTIGSLDGEGTVALNGHALIIGSNNLSTTFSGLIQDDGGVGVVKKNGTGTLTLSGANTYSGGTTIAHGILLVSNISGSGTGTGPVSVKAGTLGGSGIIAGAVTVGNNGDTGAFLAPSKGVRKPATLTIQGSLTLNDDSTYLYKLDTKRAKADQVIANGVLIDNGAKFSFRPSGNGALTTGQVFTVINNTAASQIVGTFHNLRDGQILTVNGNNLQASFSGGDGNDLTLTVVP